MRTAIQALLTSTALVAASGIVALAQERPRIHCDFPPGAYGNPYHGELTVMGGSPPYVWEVLWAMSPDRPLDSLEDAGMMLVDSQPGKRILMGTPSVKGVLGLGIAVTDANNMRNTTACWIRLPPGRPLVVETNPSEVRAGAEDFSLEIHGWNFEPGSRVEWLEPGSRFPALLWPVWVEERKLLVRIPAVLLDEPGEVTIWVMNQSSPALGDGFKFTIHPRQRPMIESVDESSVAKGSLEFGFRVTGQNLRDATVEWQEPGATKWDAVATVPVSPTELMATVPGKLLRAEGDAGVRAVTRGGLASNSLSVKVNTIEIACPVSAAESGVEYSGEMRAEGGLGPYEWSVVNGLPPGLHHQGGGRIEGEPGDLVSIAIMASAQGEVAPKSEVGVRVTRKAGLNESAHGELELSFQSDSMIEFPDQNTAIPFTFCAQPQSPDTEKSGCWDQWDTTIPTGTVAGMIEITGKLDAASFAFPFQVQVQDARGAPAERACTITVQDDAEAGAAGLQVPLEKPVIWAAGTRGAGSGFTLVVTGYSTPRVISEVRIELAPAPGKVIEPNGPVVLTELVEVFRQWYETADSQEHGSQFQLEVPLPVEGVTDAISAVTVRLSNQKGSSECVINVASGRPERGCRPLF